jgi:hypothetical protein
MKKTFLNLINFILDHNVILISITLPLLFMVFGLVRVFLGINLMSDPSFFLVVSSEVVSFFLLLYYNFTFFIKAIFITNEKSSMFFSLFYKNLKTYNIFQKIALISHTVFYAIPIKTILSFKNPIFTIITTITNIFFVWLFSLHLFFGVYLVFILTILFEGFLFYIFFSKNISFLKKITFNIFFGMDNIFKVEYLNFFYTENFQIKCLYKILQLLLSCFILFIIYYQETIELEIVQTILSDLKKQTPQIFDLPTDNHLGSVFDNYNKNLNMIEQKIILENTVFLKTKKLLTEFVYKMFFDD